MISMEDEMEKENIEESMILKVNEEMIFEVNENEVEKNIKVVRRVMENEDMNEVQIEVKMSVDEREENKWEEEN